MFDFLGNLREQQEAMQHTLAEITIEHTSDDGSVTVIMDANRKLKDVRIDRSKIDINEPEQLEDILVVTVNAAMAEAEVKAEAEMKKMMGGMLPGGLDQLLGG